MELGSTAASVVPAGSRNDDSDRTTAVISGSVVGGLALVALVALAVVKGSTKRSVASGTAGTAASVAKAAGSEMKTTTPVEAMLNDASALVTELDTTHGEGSLAQGPSEAAPPLEGDFTTLSLDPVGGTASATNDAYGFDAANGAQ